MVRGGAYLPKRLGMVGICVLVSILAIALFVSPALACHGWISDRVWEDSNGNGIQDEGEPGISGVTVKLHKCSDDSVITTKVTDSNGLYQFQAATLGNYYIEFAAPAGYVFSLQNQGTDDGKDSDADAITGKTACTALATDENDKTWDAGLYRPASVGNFVWEDLNKNGIQDEGEIGIEGVTVDLYACGGQLVGSTTTNSTGYYLFFNLAPGGYYLQFAASDGFLFSPQNAGGDDADSDADNTGKTDCFTLHSDDNITIWDAGLYQEELPAEEPPSVPSITTWGIAALTVVLAGSGLLMLKTKAVVRNS